MIEHTIEDRISYLRQTKELSQESFGSKLGVTKSTISLIERKLRTPSDRIIRDVCREFNVNENWLRTGEGSMFIELPEEDEFMKAAASISKSNDKFAMQMLIEYWKLDDDSKQIFTDYLKKVVKNSQK